MTPSGSLIDGSAGETIHLQHGDHYWVDNGYIEDIPIGRYIVTAELQTEEGNQPLRIRDWNTEDDFAYEFQLDFTPAEEGNFHSAFITIGY